MADKMKVKDLAAELGIGNKELLNKLRELDIPVKSLMSSLSDEQVVEIRSQLSGGRPSTEVIRKEIQPGVVVRRRKRARPGAPEEAEGEEGLIEADEELAAEAPEAVEHKAEPKIAQTPPAPEEPAQEPPLETTFADAKIILTPEQNQAFSVAEPEVAPEPAPDAKPRPKDDIYPDLGADTSSFTPKEAPSEILTGAPLGQEDQDLSGGEAPAGMASDKRAPEVAGPEEAPVQAHISGTQVETEEGQLDEHGRRKRKPKRPTEKEKFSGPQVRIIARPEPAPAKPVQPAQPRPQLDQRPQAGQR
ncbi:translation initiation factor IF-2 N-terminal domain-containing protein, partial [Desulfocurvibacter africanus]